MADFSVVIITFNEERNIQRCLTSAFQVSDDVIVWDSNSIDSTVQIAESMGARVFSKDWQGYSISKNLANDQAKYDWVLSLDADECFDEVLVHSLLKWKLNDPVPASFHRLTNYCGSWIKHCGWYPDTKFRLFNRHEVNWEGLIHEHLQSKREISPVVLKGNCLHYSYYDREGHYAQALKFVTLMAREKVLAGKRTTWGMRWLSPLAKFFNMYFIKLGFLDGIAGWHVCRISAWAAYQKYALWFQFQSEKES
jgi:glycosyltransferase involved in cell wall biosynthesis